MLDPVAAGRWRTARLTVNYRTPRPAMALAAALLPPSAEPPLSVRDSSEPPWCAHAGEDLADLVRRERELIGAGRVAVIAPPARPGSSRHPRAGGQTCTSRSPAPPAGSGS